MAGGGVGEAALLEAVMASEIAGAAVGGAELAGGIGALAGAGELAGLSSAAGGIGALEGAGRAGGSGGLANLTPLLDGEFGIAAALAALLLASSGLCVFVVLRFSQSKEAAFV